MQKFGIDISKWQGNFNIASAKTNGVEFTIIKIGGGDDALYSDKEFKNNYNKCIEAGVPKGCYFYGNAHTVEEAKEEAYYWVSLMQGCTFELPVFYDVEGDMLSSDINLLTQIVGTVCDIVKSKGYNVGIYASESVFNSKLYDDLLTQYHHWVAKWSTNPPSLKSGHMVDLWQFGGNTNYIRDNKINGQVVDQDYCYIEFGSCSQPNANVKTDSELVSEIIAGKWGNGDERKRRLSEAGYDYDRIQNLVNEELGNKNSVSLIKIAEEVVQGKWGNGAERKERLTTAGYNYDEVQKLVNEMMKG